MVSRFNFPTRIEFGAGAAENLPAYVREFGSRPLVVTDQGLVSLPLFQALVERLKAAGLPVTTFSGVSPNPDDPQIAAGAAAFRAGACDCVVGIGGGSALDAAKAIALMARHTGVSTDYDDRIDGWKMVRPADVPPILAVPTTAGTGSEVGRSAVITNPNTHVKIVVFAPCLLPRLALIDPVLMQDLPPKITAYTGMDALTHAVEAVMAKGYHPMCTAIGLEAIRMVMGSLKRAVENGHDLDARAEMALAAAMGAVAFQKGLGAAHSLAHPLSAISGVPHGLANAIVLPHVLAFNRDAALAGLAQAGRVLGYAGSDAVCADAAIAAIVRLGQAVGLPQTLSAAGVRAEDLDRLAEHAFADACHQSNPRPCSQADLRKLYERAFA